MLVVYLISTNLTYFVFGVGDCDLGPDLSPLSGEMEFYLPGPLRFLDAGLSFDNSHHQRSVKVLWEYSFLLPIVRPVESFLSGWEGVIRLDDTLSDSRPRLSVFPCHFGNLQRGLRKETAESSKPGYFSQM